MRNAVIILVTVVLLGGGLFVFILSGSDDQGVEQRTDPATTNTDQTNQETAQNPPIEEKRSIRIAAMGDMLPHDTVNLRANNLDYLQFLDRVQPELEGSDIVFCNQESPSAGEAYGISGYPSFNAPEAFARDLHSFGCNLVNLANNHIADKGQEPANITRDLWESLNVLAVSGTNSSQQQQDTVQYFTVEGKTFAFIAFTDLSNNRGIPSYTVNMFETGLVSRLASEASANADYVIASAHWGIEDSSVVSESQRAWAQLLADNGVDIVLGSGPHVLQPVEKIDDTLVIYSLGNFLSTQLTIDQLTGGIAYIDIPLDGGEMSVSFLPTYMSYTWTAEQAATEDLLARDNLDVVPLDQASLLIEDSLFDASTNAIQSRVTDLLNQSFKVEILSSN